MLNAVKKVGKFNHGTIYKKRGFFLDIAMFSLDTSWAMEKKLLTAGTEETNTLTFKEN